MIGILTEPLHQYGKTRCILILRSPEHAGDAIQSPASAGARIEGECSDGNPYCSSLHYGACDQASDDTCPALRPSPYRAG